MAGKLKLLRSANDESGFTLLETMIALAIVVFMFAAVISVESSSVDALQRTKRMNSVTMLARQVITEAEMEFEGLPLKEMEIEKGENFPPPFEEYRWTRVIKEIEFPDIMGNAGGAEEEAGAVQSGGGAMAGDMIGRTMTKYLSEALRELTVTIYWKRGEGEQSYSISTWLVDLNSEMRVNP